MGLEEAIEAQKTTPKKILISFYDTSAPSKLTEKNTFGHSVISNYVNENFYPVKFNANEKRDITLFGRTFKNAGTSATSKHDFTKFINVNSVPAIVFLDEQSAPITSISGYVSAKELDPYLKIISNNDYKKFKSRGEWETAQTKFKTTIKD